MAIFTEKLVATFALERFIRELVTHDALDLVNHLSLKLVLDFFNFDIKTWNRVRPKNKLYTWVSDDEIHPLVDTQAFFLGVHLFKNWMHTPLVLIHLLNRHIFLFNI